MGSQYTTFVGRRGAAWLVSTTVLVAFVGTPPTTAVASELTELGTQPPLVNALRPPSDCAGCHGDFDATSNHEPWPTWAGSMMAQAGRDPLFWASLDVANHDIPGAGEYCLRCHAPGAWLAERVQPPTGTVDGCTMTGDLDVLDNDFSGLTCHVCHRMQVNAAPPPGEDPVYFENGNFWIDDVNCGNKNEPCRHGPYDYDADGSRPPNHAWAYSSYVVSSDHCGNCHNVTSPVINLVIDGEDTGIPMPIERTFKEWQQSDFADPASALFATCQDCHMPQAEVSPAYACSQKKNDRTGNLKVHELAGGNAWIPEVLRLVYPALGLDANLIATRDAAIAMLESAAVVEVTAPDTVGAGGTLPVQVRVTNLSGHKLPTGYPEGRRMWLHLAVYDGDGALVYESAGYDAATGVLVHDEQARIYLVEPGIWDHNGTDECDVADDAGSPIFHFVLNNCIHVDNRIPPQGFTGGEDLETRPVGHSYPETSPGSGVLVNYDTVDYDVPVPVGAVGPLSAVATLRYQTTSKEYIEFLHNEATEHGFPDDCTPRTDGLIGMSRAAFMLELWQTYGRSAPVDMASDAASVTVGGGSVCDNGVVESGETCDPIATCPTACDDGEVCTTDMLLGAPETCDAECEYAPITACTGGDLCCPAGCNANDDADCDPVCDNGVVESGELCDPIASCPTACDDGEVCTTDTLSGSAATCTAECVFTSITACVGGDGCCPAGCDATGDSDCDSVCDNGVVESGETCDPIASCPTACDDGEVCTTDTLSGSAATCTAECVFTPITACVGGDGCCPAGCDANGDSDCDSVCDNGVVESGETCDPIASCPTACDDGEVCTTDTLSGSAATCTAECVFTPITACVGGDGCCPGGCNANDDSDCEPVCDNGVVESGETCDPPESCPSSCDDGEVCTADTLSGSAATCDAACVFTPITACVGGDGCCPGGCNANDDSDCEPVCDNGVVESGETCDPPESCPSLCDDGEVCTADALTGAAATCDAACVFTPITACVGGDGCCPAGCNANGDSDCEPICDNGVVEPGETCDPVSTCPTACSDGVACTIDTLTGAAASCTAKCTFVPITTCSNGDGCCAAGCDATTDTDCSASCGNGVVEAGETCDPPESCPTSCDDGDACTVDTLTGSAAACSAACSYNAVSECGDGDGCCPAGCDATTDTDCAPSCGNGVIEPGETCDPPGSCPASCDDDDACTVDTMTGSAADCTAACGHDLISACADGDGCCPADCDATTDSDCSPSCGNGVVEEGETCDPPESCPASCDDGNACTIDTLTGSAAACTAACDHGVISTCQDGDGCCAAGCDATTDADCSASCGNGVVEVGETCDPPESCPTSCDDGNACTVDTLTGSAAACSAACSHSAISACSDGDGCCPAGCDATTDSDCSASCGNGVVEVGETCDPPESCPTSCDDGNACTVDTLTGSAAACSAACSHSAISACSDGDGCCPAGCDATADSDCSASCGNGVVEAGETCDPPESCPTSCDDGDACTIDTLTGSAAACSADCSYADITACTDGDGCCPAGCDASVDADCGSPCGNGTLDEGETCDPPESCPVDCDDGDACTVDWMSGAPETCDVACDHGSIQRCVSGDGCCPTLCTFEDDADCAPPESEPEGCSCDVGPGGPGSSTPLLALGVLLWLVTRRRRATRRRV